MSKPFDSPHFTLQPLAEGVFACIHKVGGAAFSNAGIISLGSVTLAVDAMNSLAAGKDLRRTAEELFDCPVETLILTHAHNDHWMGAAAFDEDTTLLANEVTAESIQNWGKKMLQDFNVAEWQTALKKTEQRLVEETDERVRAGLKNALIRTRTALEEMPTYQPRFPDHTFTDQVDFYGTDRRVEMRSLGRGHSGNDAVVFLPDDRIAFIGDIGFFKSQPYLADCDLELYRTQLLSIVDAEYQVLVPGHGAVGGKPDIELQLRYMEILEELVGQAVKKGFSIEEILELSLPEPFAQWLMGGMERFRLNLKFMFKHCDGV